MQNCSKALLCAALFAVLFSLGTTAQEKNSLAEFRRLHDELRDKMADDLIAATIYLESKIEVDPESEDLNVLRQSLASRLASEGNFKAANEQFAKLLEFQLQHAQDARNQYGAWMTIQSMQEVAEESGNTASLNEAIELAYIRLTKFDANLLPVSQLAVLKARLLADDGKDKEAKDLVEEHVAKLAKTNATSDATEESMQAYVAMFRALTDEGEDNELWFDQSKKELEALVAAAIQKYPDSLPLQSSYAETQLLKITRWSQEDPDKTKELIDTALSTLEPFANKNAAVRATLKRIELYKMQMSSAKPKESLVGKPAPDWDIDGWVNTIDMQREDLDGKVVLLDFWAMWCGPCIATFPHLRKWREEFGDEDFEIVGVTTYYNFEWDEEKNRASRSRKDVSAADERQTIARFLEHHKLEHPVIVTPEGSGMNGQYGVRGIPHVVLIDKEGVVQLIKTGAGKETAAAIQKKIEELLGS
ncbi:TlpA family protein disulfide reductase [Planctomycetes bacterium K23_9]|uniref:Thiol-disulfide oxidoreductase ResA n=1 Tax=Stieleria marina TaxID=1930275 RepID=A0A517P152_9BACT|nr:Thiol-disulfide oxidoreductase ResA [Planctomycetes bacterium K23_9]